MYLRPGLKKLGKDLLPLASLNSMTLVGAETVGRSYGGGMLKLEPKEADLLPVPSPAIVEAACDALRVVRPRVAKLLSRPGGLVQAVALVDRVLLIDALDIEPSEVKSLSEAYTGLAARRVARGRSRPGS